MRRVSVRPRQVAALAALAALPLAGCAGVPGSSPAQVVDPMPANAPPPEGLTRSLVVVEPERDDSPRDIVNKFIKAQANPERGHGVARQFLSPKPAETWDDDSSVRITDAAPYVRSVSSDSSVDTSVHVEISVHQVGLVSSNGSYTAEQGTYSYTFHLAKVDGQWRINNPAAGVTVDIGSFKKLYRSYTLYYLDQAEKHAIGDLRYFAPTSTSSATSRATLFLRLLQQAPSPALGTAVHSELVGGVRLAGNVVQGQDKVFRVYLTGLGGKAAAVRNAATAQITWTLSQLPSSGVKIFDDGEPLDLRGVDQPTKQSDWQSFDPDALPVNTIAYYVQDGALYTADGTPAPGPAGQGAYSLSSVAVSLTSDANPGPRVAGVSVTDGGATLYLDDTGDGTMTARLHAHSLITPTWDPTFDEVWTVRDGRLVRVPRRGRPAPVDAQSLDTLGDVHELRLSRDGTRVAIVAGAAGRLYLARVVRDNGQVAVEAPVEVAPSLPGVHDVAWESSTTLLVLASGQGDDRLLRTVSVDGAELKSETKVGLPGPPVAVAAAPNLPSIVESDGSLWQRSGDHWTTLVRGQAVEGTAPTYPD